MNCKLTAIVITLAGLVPFVGRSATTYEFVNKYSTTAKNLANPSEYSKTGFPGVAGDYWQIAAYGSGLANLSMSASVTCAFGQTTIKTGATAAYTATGSALALESGDYEIYHRARGEEEGNNGTTPLAFQTYYAVNGDLPWTAGGPSYNHVQLQRTAAAKAAAYRWSEISYAQSTIEAISTFDFKGGTFNAYDPAGAGTEEADQAGSWTFGFWNGNAGVPGVIAWLRSGFTLRVPNVVVDCTGTDATKTKVNVNGANVFVGNNFTNQGGTLTVDNGATVSITRNLTTTNTKSVNTVEGSGTTVSVGGNYASSGYLTVKDSAAMTVAGSTTLSAGGDFTLDGATYSDGGAAFTAVAGSSVVITNGATISLTSVSASGPFKFHDSTINFKAANSQDLALRGASVIAGATTLINMTNGTLTAANAGLTITDGATVNAKSIVFDGGQTVFTVGTNATLKVTTRPTIDTNNSGGNLKKLVVDGGTFDSPGGIDMAGDNGMLWLKNGTISFAGEGIRVKENAACTDGGYGTVRVDGGTLSGTRIKMARCSSASYTGKNGGSRLEINGGLVNLTGDGVFFFQGGTGYTRDDDHYLVLNGGTLRSVIKEGADSGKIHFQANGGTWQPTGESTSGAPALDPIFTDTAIGDNGFIVDTRSYATFVKGDFQSASDQNGRIVKRGSAKLTLMPQGGTWSVGATVEAGMLAYYTAPANAGDVEVKAGATLEIAAGQTLVVDDLVVTNGTIKIGDGGKIVVNGRVAVSGMSINWATLPTDATSFLEIAGELDADTISDLNGTTCVGIPSGKQAVYLFNYDAGTGRTTVVSQLISAGEAVWTGSGAWATAANWLANVKGDSTKTAVFGTGAAGQSVTLGAEEAAAVRVDAGDYSFSTGSLAVGGNLEIAADASLAVKDGAEVTVTGTSSLAAGGALTIDSATYTTGGTQFETPAGSSIVVTNGATLAAQKLYTSGALSVYDSTIGFTTAAHNLTLYGRTLFSGSGTVLDMTGGDLYTGNGGLTVADGASITTTKLVPNAGQACVNILSGASVQVKDVNGFAIDTDNANGNLKVVTVDGGTLTSPVIDIGCGSGNGRLVVNSGTVNVTGGNAIRMKEFASSTDGGVASIIVNGGELNAQRIKIGRMGADYTGKNGGTRIEVNGGLISLTDNNYGMQFFQNTTGNAHTRDDDHYVVLNGGILSTVFTKSADGSGKIHFQANGGTWQPKAASSSGSPAIPDIFTDTAIGDNGFIIDTLSYTTYVKGDFQSASDQNGRIVKRGSAKLTLMPQGGTWSVGATVEAGTLAYDTAPANAGDVEVKAGATLEIAAGQTLVVDDLVVTNGTIKIGDGGKIVVNGRVAVEGLTINWVTVPDEATSFLEVNGELDADAVTELRRSAFANVLPAGFHASVTTEVVGGRTIIRACKAEDAPISDLLVWKGTGSWAAAANWEGGSAVPTEAQKAAFTDEDAGRTVAITAGDKAGAVTFGVDGYTLSGTDPLYIAGGPGAAQIEVTAGDQTIDAPVKLFDAVTAPIAAESSLTLKKSVSDGSLAKDGTGRLVLEGANAFTKGVSSAGGITEVRNSGAFGSKLGSGAGTFTLAGGTLVFGGENPLHIADAINVEAPNNTDFTAFKVDVDTELDKVSVTKGCFIKRGTGKLTINIPGGEDYRLGTQGGNATNSLSQIRTGIAFPADGTAPAANPDARANGYYYLGFGIYEGEVCLRGSGTGAKASIANVGGGFGSVGFPFSGCAADANAVFTLDNVTFTSGSQAFVVGNDLGGAGYRPKTATLNLLNGAKCVVTATSQFGYSSTAEGARTYVNATNSTLCFKSGSSYLSRMYGNLAAYAVYSFKDSRLEEESTGIWLGGGLKADFDNSYFGGVNGDSLELRGELNGTLFRPWGELVFRNGSVLMLNAYEEKGSNTTGKLRFVFDDAEWAFSQNRESKTWPASAYGKTIYEMRGKGVTFKPASGATYTINAVFEGEGGMTLDGQGTVVFGEDALAFTGSPLLKQGTLDAAGQTIHSPTFLASNTATPVLKDCEIDDRVILDMEGETPVVGTTYTVAAVSGSTTSTGLRAKLVNVGSGKFALDAAVENGQLKLTVAAPRPSMFIIK